MFHLHWFTFLATSISLDICLAITTPVKPPGHSEEKLLANVYERCISRIGSQLDSMRRRDDPTSRDGEMDLSGYALHHPLQSRHYDMYVTGMRVRVPGRTAWFRVEQCLFEPHNRTLETRLLFKDLAVSGQVKLYAENTLSQDPRSTLPTPVDACNMTLRFRRAGVGLTAIPHKAPRGGRVDVETQARFFEPDFVSVYAYGCRAPTIEHRRGSAGILAERRQDDPEWRQDDPERRREDFERKREYSERRDAPDWERDLLERRRVSPDKSLERKRDHPERWDSQERQKNYPDRQQNSPERRHDALERQKDYLVEGEGKGDLREEMEDVFLRGTKSLLISYLEKQLQPALRETLMMNLGYTLSYGRR